MTSKTSTPCMLTTDQIDQAILLSKLSQNPVHISGQWFAWADLVLSKRLLLAVLFARTYGHAMVATSGRVIADYDKLKHEIPTGYHLKFEDSLTNTRINQYARMIGQSFNPGDTVVELTIDEMRDTIIAIFGEEHEEVIPEPV